MKPATTTLPAGWMGKHSRRWLAAAARDAARIIEVGCWYGRSTKVLAEATSGHVWAVDHWRGTPHDEAQHSRLYAELLAAVDPFAEFTRNLAPEIATGRVIPVRMASTDAAAHLLETEGPGSFDFVFLDADHSYEGIVSDIACYLPLVRRGGLLAGHDYHWPGVQQAVDEYFPTATKGPKSLWSIHV